MESALTVKGVAKNEDTVWEATYPHGQNMWFRSGEFTSDTPLEGITTPAGRHHVMIMARASGLKVYMDQQRLVNLPEVNTADGPAVALEIRMWATTHPRITNVRYAEGCKPAQDLLASGKLVTYGIRFATGSDVVLPESAPVLRQVAAWLKANPAAKLTITGHTDNVGTAADNLALSQRRSASVARVLTEQFAVAADRLATQGKGDTQSVADNARPEGRAMNRRVEFAKL
jgi:outer membrane protein OmpA-like peptidoglycan-associated protein